MKRAILLAVTMVLGFAAHAETQLTCWNMYSKKGSKPIMKAKIESETTLANVQFDLKNDEFSSFFIDKTEDSGEQWQHKPAVTKSELANPDGKLKPTEAAHSPYKGDNQYSFEFGSFSLHAPYMNNEGKYKARLILPADLSNENLKTFRIRTASERSNAVLIYQPPYLSDQEGDGYLRMFCVSK